MRKSNDKKGHSLFGNIVFCHKKLKEYMGVKYFIIAPFFILFSVVVPLLFAVLPSVVIKVLSSNLEVSKSLLSIVTYTLVLCIMNFLLKRLELGATLQTFLFRVTFVQEIFEKSLSIPYEKIESPSGKESFEKAIIAVYSGERTGIEAMMNLTAQLIINVLGLVVYSIITASLHPLLMVLIIVCPFVRLGILKINRKWKEEHKKDWTPLEVKLRYLEKECLDIRHGKDIRMYKIEKWFVKSFYSLIGKRLFWYKKEMLGVFNAQLADRIVSLIRDVCCYGYLIYKVTQGMDIAQFILYLSIIGGFSQWIKNIFDNYSTLLDNSVIINDYRRFMEEKDYCDIGGNRKLPKKKAHTITLENVGYTYPGAETPVFEGLNLTINCGEKLAVVGMNGSGKSTLIKLICGLYKPQKGRILLDGVDISEFNLEEYYSLYSVVFQEVFAFAFPIIDNIICYDNNCDKEKLDMCIEMAGLKKKIKSLHNGVNTNMLKDLDDDGINLSGGELQKLMLARALYKDSPIVILDEPTAALDPIAELEMYEKYSSFTEGKTSIFISHRLSSTVFCDRVIFLKEGKIIEDGTHESLIELKGEYANMYDIQAHYYQEEVEENAC